MAPMIHRSLFSHRELVSGHKHVYVFSELGFIISDNGNNPLCYLGHPFLSLFVFLFSHIFNLQIFSYLTHRWPHEPSLSCKLCDPFALSSGQSPYSPYGEGFPFPQVPTQEGEFLWSVRFVSRQMNLTDL